MEFEFDENKLNSFIDQQIVDGLYAVGEYAAGQARKKTPADLGNLRNSIDFEVMPEKQLARILANTEYAAIQELGGEIKPVMKKALTIPIHPSAKNKQASDFDDLFMIKKDGLHPILARKTPGGRKIIPMFLLVSKVNMPAQPYLRPAVYENLDKITEIFARG